MSEKPTDEELEAFIAKSREDIADLHQGLAGSQRRRLVIWCFRWAIGFGLIWLITWSTGRFEWLWTAGAIVALTSLALTLALPWILSRKTVRLETSFNKLRDLDQEE